MANRETIKSTSDYMNYFFNIGLRGTTETTSTILGMSNTIQNILGNLAFKTSEYLSSAETLLSGFGMVATAAFKNATESAIEFQQATASVEAISGQQLSGSDIGQKAMDMSSQFGLAVSDMTKGLDALARAGITASESLDALLESGVQMTKFEGRDLEESINDILSTTNLLNPDIDQNSEEFANTVKSLNQQIISTSESAPINAKNIMDTLQHVGGYASETGLDQEDLFATIAQLGSKGTKGELAGTSLRAFISAGQKDTAQRALSRVGLQVSDLWDESGEAILPLSEMKKVLDDALERNNFSKQERLEFYSDFVGYKQANQIMKIDPEGIDEYKEKINGAMSLTDKMNIILGTVQGNWSQIVETAKNFIIKVGDNILPVLNLILIPIKYAVKLIDAIPFGDWVAGFGLTVVAVGGISALFNSLIPAIITFTNKFINFQQVFKDNKKPPFVMFFEIVKKNLQESKEILKEIKSFSFEKLEKRTQKRDEVLKGDETNERKSNKSSHSTINLDSLLEPINKINTNVKSIYNYLVGNPINNDELVWEKNRRQQSATNNSNFNNTKLSIENVNRTNKLSKKELDSKITTQLTKDAPELKQYNSRNFEHYFKKFLLRHESVEFFKGNENNPPGYHPASRIMYTPYIAIDPEKIYNHSNKDGSDILRQTLYIMLHEFTHATQLYKDFESSDHTLSSRPNLGIGKTSYYGHRSGSLAREFDANFTASFLLKELTGMNRNYGFSNPQYSLAEYYFDKGNFAQMVIDKKNMIQNVFVKNIDEYVDIIDNVLEDMSLIYKEGSKERKDVGDARKYLRAIYKGEKLTHNEYAQLAYENFFIDQDKVTKGDKLMGYLSDYFDNNLDSSMSLMLDKTLKETSFNPKKIVNKDFPDNKVPFFNNVLASVFFKQNKNGYMYNDEGILKTLRYYKKTAKFFDENGAQYDINDLDKNNFVREKNLEKIKKNYQKLSEAQKYAVLTDIATKFRGDSSIANELIEQDFKNSVPKSFLENLQTKYKNVAQFPDEILGNLLGEDSYKDAMIKELSQLDDATLLRMSPVGKKIIERNGLQSDLFIGDDNFVDDRASNSKAWTDVSFMHNSTLKKMKKDLLNLDLIKKPEEFLFDYLNNKQPEQYNEIRYRGAVRSLFTDEKFSQMDNEGARISANMMNSDFIPHLVNVLDKYITDPKKREQIQPLLDNPNIRFNQLYGLFGGNKNKQKIIDSVVKDHWQEIYAQDEDSILNAKKLIPAKGWTNKSSHEKFDKYYNIFKDKDLEPIYNMLQNGQKPKIDDVRPIILETLQKHYEQYQKALKNPDTKRNQNMIAKFEQALTIFDEDLNNFFERKREGVQKAIAGINKGLFNPLQYKMYTQMLSKQVTKKPNEIIDQQMELTDVVLKYVKDDIKEAAEAIKKAHKEGVISEQVWNMFDKAYNKGQIPSNTNNTPNTETHTTNTKPSTPTKRVTVTGIYHSALGQIINILTNIETAINGTSFNNKNVPPTNGGTNSDNDDTSNNENKTPNSVNANVEDVRRRAEERRRKEQENKNRQKPNRQTVEDKWNSTPFRVQQIVPPWIWNMGMGAAHKPEETRKEVRDKFNFPRVNKWLDSIDTEKMEGKIATNREAFDKHVGKISGTTDKLNGVVTTLTDKFYNLSVAFPMLSPLYTVAMQVSSIGSIAGSVGKAGMKAYKWATGTDKATVESRNAVTRKLIETFKGTSLEHAVAPFMTKMRTIISKIGKWAAALIEFILSPIGLAIAGVAVVAGVALYASKKYHDSQIADIKKESKELKAKKKAAEATYYSTARSLQSGNLNDAQKSKAETQFDKAAAELQTIANQQSALVERQYNANQSMWGEYGGVNRVKLALEWTGLVEGEHYGKDHPKTTQQIRNSIEYGFGQMFDKIYGGVDSGASTKLYEFFRKHERSFIKMEQNEEALTKLYDIETQLINKYGSLDAARQSTEFNQAVTNLANETNSSNQEIISYLDWMQNNWIVEQAKEQMQLNADNWLAQTRLGLAGEEAKKLGFSDEELDESLNLQLIATAEQILNQTKKEMFLEGLMDILGGLVGVIVWGAVAAVSFMQSFFPNLHTAIFGGAYQDAYKEAGKYALQEADKNWAQIIGGTEKIGKANELTLDTIMKGVDIEKYKAARMSGLERNGINLSEWANLHNEVNNSTAQSGVNSNDNNTQQETNAITIASQGALRYQDSVDLASQAAKNYQHNLNWGFVGENSNLLVSSILYYKKEKERKKKQEENKNNKKQVLQDLIDESESETESESSVFNALNGITSVGAGISSIGNPIGFAITTAGFVNSLFNNDNNKEESDLPKVSDVSSENNDKQNNEEIDITVTGNTITINADNERMKDKEYVKAILRESLIEIANDTKSDLVSILSEKKDINNNPNGGSS